MKKVPNPVHSVDPCLPFKLSLLKEEIPANQCWLLLNQSIWQDRRSKSKIENEFHQQSLTSFVIFQTLPACMGELYWHSMHKLWYMALHCVMKQNADFQQDISQA